MKFIISGEGSFSFTKFKHQNAAPAQIILSGDWGSQVNRMNSSTHCDPERRNAEDQHNEHLSINETKSTLFYLSFPPTTSNTHSQHHPLPHSAPILLVSLDMLPSPLPTHFSAPLHFGHSYIYGVIRCGSPSRASRITAHTELWRAEGCGGGA